MAKPTGKPEKPSKPQSTVNAAIRLTTAILQEHAAKVSLEATAEPIDCDAVRALIESAQSVYFSNCSIATPRE